MRAHLAASSRGGASIRRIQNRTREGQRWATTCRHDPAPTTDFRISIWYVSFEPPAAARTSVDVDIMIARDD